MTAKSKDTCLQCGQHRAAARAGNYCATVDYFGETADEWPRHRWADWSDAILRSFGIPEDRWPEYRRASVFTLEWEARLFECERSGHVPAPDNEPICCRCYASVPALDGDSQ